MIENRNEFTLNKELELASNNKLQKWDKQTVYSVLQI